MKEKCEGVKKNNININITHLKGTGNLHFVTTACL
jgi:hypothetical protein